MSTYRKVTSENLKTHQKIYLPDDACAIWGNGTMAPPTVKNILLAPNFTTETSMVLGDRDFSFSLRWILHTLQW